MKRTGRIRFGLGGLFILITLMSIALLVARNIDNWVEFGNFLGMYLAVVSPIFVIFLPILFTRWFRLKQHAKDVQFDRELVLMEARAKAAAHAMAEESK